MNSIKDSGNSPPDSLKTDYNIPPEWQERAPQFSVDLSPEGLVLPNPDTAALDAKIIGSLAEGADRIDAARQQGKRIVYLPGSYDLVHVGHLSYLDQVRKHCLESAAQSGQDLTADNLFVVMLADDDELIARIKADKYIGNGGSELFRRPVDAGFDEGGRSPRLDALASLPADLVGFIPSPAASELPAPYKLDLAMCQEIAASMAIGADLEHFTEILATYQRFEDLSDHHHSLTDAPWRIAAWQLYVTLQLVTPTSESHASTPEPYAPGSVTRVMSAHDRHYYGAVNMISRWSGVAVDVIDDQAVVSTTGLLQRFGPDTLLNHRAAALHARNS